ncbi:GNAT family N-acetyltransferase [candidate division GN15 bacterium]|nr:GNAT family N-acetyltransferase [candidate division GN15 bacterium]
MASNRSTPHVSLPMTAGHPSPTPFSLPQSHASRLTGTLLKVLRRPLEKTLQLETLNELYRLLLTPENSCDFINRALSLLNVRYDVAPQDRERIPTEGPVIVVANHPFGAIEGIILLSLLRSVRTDVRVMANYLLARIPEMRPWLIAVDPFGGRGAAGRNLRPLREAIAWLERDSLLGIFPAGEVAHLQMRTRHVSDPNWSPTVARLVRLTDAPVVPVYFDGTNSPLFHAAGLVHPRLRTALLPRELLNKSDRCLTVRIGSPISSQTLNSISGDRQMMSYLRLRTYLLSERCGDKPPVTVRKIRSNPITKSSAIAAQQPPDRLAVEVSNLPVDALMAEHGDYAAYCVRPELIPGCLREIGRLREITFRAAGEGTGHEVDLDRFDLYYLHLFVWNRDKNEIAGAYRLGLTDEIVRTHGIKGLYTKTLFRYRRRLIDHISPAIELGRSFIREEYQREFTPLHLLWRGIGQVVVRNPRYRRLFGPVSISSRYRDASIRLLVDFLKENSFDDQLSRLVKPRSPLKNGKGAPWRDCLPEAAPCSLEEVSRLIGEIEVNGEGIPILLKQYLKLGGRLLAFNVDPAFNDALDGLIVVDLVQTPERVLERYLGKTGTQRFHSCHAPIIAGAGGHRTTASVTAR